MPRKIALLGTAPSGQHAPFRDFDWEIWGVSCRAQYVTRADRWFELHRLEGEPKEWADNWRKDMKRWLDTDPIPVYMLYPESLSESVSPYPTEEITRRFGTFFMTSTFAWMAAMAINELAPHGKMAEEGSEIGIWGVDMEYGTEYREQRVGIRHFMELAKHLGIKTRKLVTGGLTYEPVPYPLWQDDPLLNKLKQRHENAAISATENAEQLQEIRNRYYEIQGALKEIEMMINRPIVDDEEPKPYNFVERQQSLENERKAKEDLGNKLQMNKHACQAIMGEQEWLMDYLKP